MNPQFITRNISLFGEDIEQKRLEIKEYFIKTFELFEKLFEIFQDDSVFYEQPEKLRHKLIFYFGHTAAFYINKLILSKAITQRINPNFESIFAIGVDEMSWDDLNQSNYDWPSVDAVREYRKEVKKIVCEYIDQVEFSLPINRESSMWVIMMGTAHERIHLETSSVLHRQLDIKYVKKHPFWSECKEFSSTYPKNELIDVEGAKVVLGKEFQDDFYGWDNEYGKAEFIVEEFKASKYLVSNGEFLEFVNDGGYKKDKYWEEESLNWKKYTKALYPSFWIQKEERFLYRTLTDLIPLPLNWPVDVNFHEAMAFCRYKSEKEKKNISLPSEAMWYRLHQVSGLGDEPFWSKEQKAPANINLEHFVSASPVDRFKHGEFYDVIGNVWQWTTTSIDGFKGFCIDPLYDDFSTPTFDGRHNLIKGGSFISTGNEVLLSSRYAFRRHFFQHAGFRYVEIQKDTEQEKQELSDNFYFENESFFSDIVKIVKRYKQKSDTKFLHLGCEHGKTLLELANDFEKLYGIDFTARNIMQAQKNLKRSGYKNIEFWQGDSCNLRAHFQGFDLIVVTNREQEIYNKEVFINTLSERSNKNSIIIVSLRECENEESYKELLEKKFQLLANERGVSIWQK